MASRAGQSFNSWETLSLYLQGPCIRYLPHTHRSLTDKDNTSNSTKFNAAEMKSVSLIVGGLFVKGTIKIEEVMVFDVL